MAKVAIIVGHDKKRKGAKLNLNLEHNEPSVYEYDYNSAVAKQIEFLRNLYHLDVGIFFRDSVGIYGAYLEAIKTKPDFILELHFNSHKDNRIQGAEILCSKEFEKHPFPAKLLPRLVGLFGGKNRGIKIPNKGIDRGYGNVNKPIPYFLVEPFFGSNPTQAKVAIDKMIYYAVEIMRTIDEYFKDHATNAPVNGSGKKTSKS